MVLPSSATIAREKGLEPLAALLFAQERDCPRPEDAARGFIDPEKGVETLADALQGANDIITDIEAALRACAARCRPSHRAAPCGSER